MHEDSGPFDVSQKLVAKADAIVSPFDQAGNVGHDELLTVADSDHAKVWILRGERVVGDFRRGASHPAEQRRLAGVWLTHQTDVGDQLQVEPDRAFLARFSGFKFARCPVHRIRKVLVSASAVAAIGDRD